MDIAEHRWRRSGVAKAAAERERIRLGVVDRYRRLGREEGGGDQISANLAERERPVGQRDDAERVRESARVEV